MSAGDRPLMEILLQVEAETTPAEKAVLRALNVLTNAAAFLEPRELRCVEILLEGLGVPTAKRVIEVQNIIQVKRDRLMAKRAAREGAPT